MNFFVLFSLINGISASVFGLFVYLKNRKSLVNKNLFLMSIGVAIWSFSYAKWLLVPTEESALFWSRMLNFGATLIPVFYLHWILAFLNLDKKKRGIITFGYIITFIFLLLSFTPYYVQSVEHVLFFPYWPQAGPLYICFIILGYIGLVGYGLYQLFKNRKTAVKEKRNQIDYIILGTILGFGGGATNFPLMFGVSLLPPFGHPFVSVHPFLWMFAILKYHLFEIRVLLTELLVGVMGLILLLLPFLMPSPELKLLTGFVLFLFILFGYLLIKYTHLEIKRKEEAEALAVRERVLREEAERLAEKERQVAEQFQVVAIRAMAFKQGAEELAKRERVLRQKAQKTAQREKNLRLRAERLSRAREQFLLSSQHYFRTPLTAIRGFIDLALTSKVRISLAQELKKWLLGAQKGAEELRKRIEESLDISQFQMGKGVLELKEVDLKELVENLIKQFQIQLKQKGLYLKTEFPQYLPKIKVDEKRIIEAISNLIENAVKHTLKGGIIIGLKKLTEKNSILFWVKDTGIGIPKEELKYVGSVPFERSKAGQELSPLGKGIGLYLSRLIIEAHGGKLWVESEGQGKGSTFYVELPIK